MDGLLLLAWRRSRGGAACRRSYGRRLGPGSIPRSRTQAVLLFSSLIRTDGGSAVVSFLYPLVVATAALLSLTVGGGLAARSRRATGRLEA